MFRAGDQSHALYAVRSGALKSYCTTEGRDEQVLGFALPGELVGLDGMSDDAYASNLVVLETTSICEFSYNDLEELCHSLRGLNHQLMRLASKEITTDHKMLLLLGKRKAEEKLAAFLLNLSTRYKPRGLSATNFNLPMSRQDIGNYLRLAIETVSRLFARFHTAATSMTNPIDSVWSACRVGPTKKRRLCTAHARSRHSTKYLIVDGGNNSKDYSDYDYIIRYRNNTITPPLLISQSRSSAILPTTILRTCDRSPTSTRGGVNR